MKKLLISSTVIVIFAIYAIHLHSDSVVGVGSAGISQNLSQNSIPFNTNPPISGSGAPPQNVNYKDGTYVGSVADAFYGSVQVLVTITRGKITDVQFLQYSSDRRTSQIINSQAMPYLKQEAIAAQSAQVDGVSGATATSGAFIESLQSALQQAA